MFHFRYVHKYLIASLKLFEVSWVPQWCRGDDPHLGDLFEHSEKPIQAFKQSILEQIKQDAKNLQYYSVGNVDNYLKVPFFGKVFMFNLTIVQMGPGYVNIFLKSPLFTIVFCQYVHTEEPYKQRLFHVMHASKWLPYWLTAIMLKM